MPMPFRDKTGQSFGFWTVLGFAGRDANNHTIWLCKCLCGTEKNVVVGSLLKGKSKSCGCQKYIVTAKKNTKHGMAGSPTYKSWHAMLQRCEGKGGHESYPDRNISMPKEWLNFEAFVSDMGIRPHKKTLDRIDNTKSYSKENCRWATYKEQANNKSDTIYVYVNNEKLSFMDACRKYNIGESCARHRINKGMSEQEVFTKPTKKKL